MYYIFLLIWLLGLTLSCLQHTDCQIDQYCNCRYQCFTGKANEPTTLIGYYYYTDNFHRDIYINYQHNLVYLYPQLQSSLNANSYLYHMIDVDQQGLWSFNHSDHNNSQIYLSHIEFDFFTLQHDIISDAYCIIDKQGRRAYRPTAIDDSHAISNTILFLTNETEHRQMLFINNSPMEQEI